jgi:hypothetical protein
MANKRIPEKQEPGEIKKLIAAYGIKKPTLLKRIRNAFECLGEFKIMGPPIFLYCIGILLGGILGVGITALKLRWLFIIIWMGSVFCAFIVWLPLFSRSALRILNKVSEAERNEQWIFNNDKK